MKSKTTVGQKLKRLAKKHADAWGDLVLDRCSEKEEAELTAKFLKARKNLFDAIDEITCVDHAPRALQDLL